MIRSITKPSEYNNRLLGVVLLLMVVVNLLPIGLTDIHADLTLGIFFIFTLYFSRLNHVTFIFFCGLLIDCLHERTIGLTSFLWVFWFVFLQTQRRFIAISQVLISWFVFACFIVLYNFSEWAFIKTLMPNIPLVFNTYELGLEIATYPILFKILLSYERPKTAW